MVVEGSLGAWHALHDGRFEPDGPTLAAGDAVILVFSRCAGDLSEEQGNILPSSPPPSTLKRGSAAAALDSKAGFRLVIHHNPLVETARIDIGAGVGFDSRSCEWILCGGEAAPSHARSKSMKPPPSP